MASAYSELMDLWFVAIVAVVVLLPPILAISVLHQLRIARPGRWRVILACAVLADWVLLIPFFVLRELSPLSKHYMHTPLADLFLLLSLALLIGSAVSPVGRWRLSSAAFLVLCFWVWTEQFCALSDDGSSLSVLITIAADKVGRAPEYGYFGVLHKMAVYQKRGYYDAAIYAGKAWTQANPIGGSNDRVFIEIALSYLEKANHDRAHADGYVREAIRYRDMALPIASDAALGAYSMSTLRDLALVSEYAGDLSPKQRCVQYRNSINLYEHLMIRLKDKQEEISRRFVPDKDDLSMSDVECATETTQAEVARMRNKQQSSGCR